MARHSLQVALFGWNLQSVRTQVHHSYRKMPAFDMDMGCVFMQIYAWAWHGRFLNSVQTAPNTGWLPVTRELYACLLSINHHSGLWLLIQYKKSAHSLPYVAVLYSVSFFLNNTLLLCTSIKNAAHECPVLSCKHVRRQRTVSSANKCIHGWTVGAHESVIIQVVGGKMTDLGRLGAFITKVKKGSLADVVGHLRAGKLPVSHM